MSSMAARRQSDRSDHRSPSGPRYKPPIQISEHPLDTLLEHRGRALTGRQLGLFNKEGVPTVYCAGNISLLDRPCVSIVGSRAVSQEGILRTQRLARELVRGGVVVTSGLAKGVDFAAHTSAIENGGATIAVIGTPLDKAYPAAHGHLQEEIYRNHLLLSQFAPGFRTFPSDFPKRNRTMAALSDATVIVEASDSSGTLHQAAECGRLGRWLFIMKSVAENSNLTWPSKFLQQPKVAILQDVEEILERVH